MLSRRDFLIRAGLAGTAVLVRPTTTAFASSWQPLSPVNFSVPPGACDCHSHIFGDPKRFPFAPTRTYTPEPATIDEMRALHRALHVERFVLVQPSVYGTDNSCMLDAIKQFGPSCRGIAVIDDTTSEATLDDFQRAGIRGIRLNLETAGVTDPALSRHRFQAAIARVQKRNWHIQLNTRLSVIEAVNADLMTSPVPVVFDHFAEAKAALGVDQPGFGTLLTLVRTGKIYVKISAPYHCSTEAPDFPDVAPLAKALIAANLQHILWGSNWPHPNPVPGRSISEISPPLPVDGGRIFDQLPIWAPGASERKAILVDNPAKLFGF